jgi:hypothetical protein
MTSDQDTGMTPEQDLGYHNCLLRGREVALGEAEPPLSTCRDAFLQYSGTDATNAREVVLGMWETTSQANRDQTNEACDAQDALLHREGLTKET